MDYVLVTAIRTLGGTRTIAGIKVRDAGSVLRTITSGQFRDTGGILRSFFGIAPAGSVSSAGTTSAGVSLSRTDVVGAVNSKASPQISTQSVTVTAPAGSTFLWSRTDANGGTWVVGAPSGATTSFKSPAVAPGGELIATFVCTVTPPSGPPAVTGTVTATVDNYGYNGAGPLP